MRTYLTEGVSDGNVIIDERGQHGFGYDAMFIPAGADRTYGEMTPAEKHMTSHRSNAMTAMLGNLSGIVVPAVGLSLHERRELLVEVALCVMSTDTDQLEEAIQRVPAAYHREVYEVLLQSYLFGGFPTALEGLSAAYRIHGIPPSVGDVDRMYDVAQYRAVAGVTYAIEVTAVGKTITGSTTTPDTLAWVKEPKDTLQYPGRLFELTRNDSLEVAWTAVPGVGQYVVAVECVDTLGYGEYLSPMTTDSNRRLRDQDRFDDGTLIASERVRFGFSILTRAPTVWSVFKWFGRQEIRVYAGDQAFQEWFRMVGFGRRSTYDYRLSNIKGGLGTWASASLIRKATFLKMDQLK